MKKQTTEKKRPSHTIFQVIGEGEKTRWVKIGAAWTNRDGKGINLVFDALPGPLGHTVLREIIEQEETGANNEGQK